MRRIRAFPMVVGMTGSVAVGKSHLTEILLSRRIPVFDCDKVISRIKQSQKVQQAISRVLETAFWDRNLTPEEKREYMFRWPEILDALERILLPKLRQALTEFVVKARLQQHRLVFVDAPTLFETGFDGYCDKVLVLSAPDFVRRARFMKRPGATENKFNLIKKRQLPTKTKLSFADYVIQTGRGKGHALISLNKILRELRS